MVGGTLREYLDKVRSCDDSDILETELRVEGNWLVLFYGDPDNLFHVVTGAFDMSPFAGIGQVWKRDGQLENDTKSAFFNHQQGTVHAQIRKEPYPIYLEDRIDGVEHSMHLMFHPLKRYRQTADMKSVILDFGEYIIEQGYTVRLPQHRLGINCVPGQ
jgi:hypothetical protein